MSISTTSRILIDNELEHAELMALLSAVRRAIQRRATRVEEVTSWLVRLRQELEEHFRQEETGGFFTEAVERQPWLKDRIDHLRQEHEMMRGEIANLVDMAAEPRPALAWWPEVEARFEELARRLSHHERLEVSVLQEAWTDDMGTKD